MDRSAEADFEVFVARSGGSLVHTAWLLTGDRGHAEDIAQAALERVAARWSKLEGNPEAYARRCVANLAHDSWRRRRSRVGEVPLSDHDPRAPGSDGVASVDLRDSLLAALRALPHRQRSVLALRYFLDLDEATTAQTLGISVGAVKSSASRGLARLREQSLAYDDDSPLPTPEEIRR